MQLDDQFFASINMANATEEQKADVADKLAEIVQTRLAMNVSQMLNEQQAEQFATLSEQGEDEKAFEYLESVLPQYPQLVEQETQAVKQEFVSDFQNVVGQLEQVERQPDHHQNNDQA